MPEEAWTPPDPPEKPSETQTTQKDRRIRCLQRAALPPLLRAIHDPPKQLWIRGIFPEKRTVPFVAVIGTRRPSETGRLFARRLTEELARAGCVIVSGLALGIDCIAHEAALNAGGQTIAVLGSGIDQPTPTSNETLAERIVDTRHGCLFSEYEPGTPAYPSQFVERNRLIAGLSHITIVIEGTETSGARHTADFALSEGREVGAVPGNPLNPLAATPNRLLKDGAMVVTCAQDVFDALGYEGPPEEQFPKTRTEGKINVRNQIETDILTILRKEGPQSMDTLADRMEISFQQLASAVTNLELTGGVSTTLTGLLTTQ